jgi:hypothetical protein
MSPLLKSFRRSLRPRLLLPGICGFVLLAILVACSGSHLAPRVKGVPAWLPVYPDSEVQPKFEAPTEQGGVQGAVSFQIPAHAGDVVEFYRDRFEAAKLEVEVLPFRSSIGRGVRIEGGDTKTGFHAIVSQEDDGTTSAIFNYIAKR